MAAGRTVSLQMFSLLPPGCSVWNWVGSRRHTTFSFVPNTCTVLFKVHALGLVPSTPYGQNHHCLLSEQSLSKLLGYHTLGSYAQQLGMT